MLRALKNLVSIWYPQKSSVRYYPNNTTFRNFLQNLPCVQITQLQNGVRIVTDERECVNECVGIYVDAGSRCENNFENGISHFFEHIAFKGTRSRNRNVLEEQIEATGARFKCFTSRDQAAYYAQCLLREVPLVVEILSDCVFNNAFTESEIENQKHIVYLEMQKYEHDTNKTLDDFLHATAFQGTPLGQSVMGHSYNLYNFNCNTIPTFLNRFYDADHTVLVGVGGIKHDQMVDLGNTFLGMLEPTKCVIPTLCRFSGSDMRYRNDSMPVANIAIVVEGPCLNIDANVVMEVAANLIGGWDRSQPGGLDHAFNIARASSVSSVCDAYKAFNINYKDTGLWGIQFVGPSLQLDDMVYLVQKEWMNLCTTVTKPEVERAKKITKTKMMANYENMTTRCHNIAKYVLYQGFIEPLHEQLSAVDRVTVADVREACTYYVYDKCPAVAGVGPTEGLLDYNRIRAGMYWLRL